MDKPLLNYKRDTKGEKMKWEIVEIGGWKQKKQINNNRSNSDNHVVCQWVLLVSV